MEQSSHCYINEGGGGIILTQTLQAIQFYKNSQSGAKEKIQQIPNRLKQETEQKNYQIYLGIACKIRKLIQESFWVLNCICTFVFSIFSLSPSVFYL